MVNVLLAQKVHQHLVQCAMTRSYTWFNAVHELIHGIHPETSEAEVQETNDVINYLAHWFRTKNMPRLTVLINSIKGSVGVGKGFWKNLGIEGQVSEVCYGAMTAVFREECYAYYIDFCGHSNTLQNFVAERIALAERDETPHRDYILSVLGEQIEAFSRASTSLEQIHLDQSVHPLIPRSLHQEFFIRMAGWFNQALRYNDHGAAIWDMEFLWNATKKLRREFTLTLPIGQEHDVYGLTLARELAEGEAYMATLDEVELLTVCRLGDPSQVMITHVGLQDGLLSKGPEGRCMQSGVAFAGEVAVNAFADNAKCLFTAKCNGDEYTHVTVRLAFRLN